MPIFVIRHGYIEVGPSADGNAMFLAVNDCLISIPPEWARKVAASLIEYADRQEKGERHPIAGDNL